MPEDKDIDGNVYLIPEVLVKYMPDFTPEIIVEHNVTPSKTLSDSNLSGSYQSGVNNVE